MTATSEARKVVLITGGTRGIGWEAARGFARSGATVALTGRDASVADTRATELQEEFSCDAVGPGLDLADETQITACFQEIHRRYRRLDVLVNNAGGMEEGLVGMITGEMIDRTLEVNVRGALLVLQAAARLMRRAAGGVIINVSSIMGTQGSAGYMVYGASKAALIGATRSAAKELGRFGIRVNAIAPGLIATDLVKHLSPETIKARVENIVLGRIGTPADVVAAITFLASDDAGYITGQVLGVDGGMLV